MERSGTMGRGAPAGRPRPPWPPAAKLTVAALALVLLVVVAVKASGSDEVRSAGARSGPATPSTSAWTLPPETSTSAASPPSTAAPTTTPPPPTAPPPAPTEPPPAVVQAPAGGGSGAGAAAALASLPDGRLDWSHPYERSQFGPAWSDTDHNGCDTRNDILRRDLTGISTRPGTHDCVVISGTLLDPYTGTTIPFLKAEASKVQIDHLVPLHAAWQLGAWAWTPGQRLTYANDPRVLLAVSGSTNQSKGDDLADEWRPPNRGYWCSYAVRTVDVHVAYRLPVTPGERSALTDMLRNCP